MARNKIAGDLSPKRLRFLVKILALCLCVLNTSCEFKKNEIEIDFDKNYDDFDLPLSLPYMENFENGTFDNVENYTLQFVWRIVDDGGNMVLKCVEIDRDKIAAGSTILSLMIGDKTWESYVFSFDCKIPDDSWATFAPFADTNADNYTPDYFDTRNPWSLSLDNEGVLLYRTIFSHGTHYIGEPDDEYVPSYSEYVAGYKKSKPIDGFIADGWNHIQLIPAGLELHMEINGVNIGKVAELQEGISGRITIGGGVGTMFDNISVESN